MHMVRIAAATASEHASVAAARVAAQGGNGVDAAVAASLVGLVTEPGIVALGSGGFLTIWPPEGPPVTIDGYAAMPGKGQDPSRFGGGVFDAWMAYGGGVTTTVGHGSVAVPGALAACEQASRRYGTLPWSEIVAPSIEIADRGFPLSVAAHRYLEHCHETIFGWHETSRRVLHDGNGELLAPGAIIRIPDLADSLRAVAEQGTDVFYRGYLGDLIAAGMETAGGLLTLEDLSTYRVVERAPLQVRVGGWELASNPPPAVGGTALAALLLLMGEEPRGSSWDEAAIERLIQAQHAVFAYRSAHLDVAEDLHAEAAKLLDGIHREGIDWLRRSPSTMHTSVVDGNGLACAATFSAGYGSGVLPPGTGIWMNNSLGEVELNPAGLHAIQPGARLLSNMAPTVARGTSGTVVAIGSPGADRITTAIAQSFLSFAALGMSLSDAVQHPRLHVELVDGAPRVAFEPGLESGVDGYLTRPFADLDMYFGGVAAAARHGGGRLEAGIDPRRSGHALVAD
jgi:gamma-glutamyltranspeptidase/glutathione hydrolase